CRFCHDDVVVLDFETTGLNPKADRIIEIGAVRIHNGQIVSELSLMVNPQRPLPDKIVEITGITDVMLRDAKPFEEHVRELLDFLGDAPVAAHNASFDVAFLQNELDRCGHAWNQPVIDTLAFARKLYPTLKSHRLGALCKHLGISLKNAHRAVHDARATAKLLLQLMALAADRGIDTLEGLNTLQDGGAIGQSFHIILLAISQEGMTNINRLVSEGHLRYFYRRPHIPRRLLSKYREGILVGSACESGELFQAILEGKSDAELREIAEFYDYLEIQPIGNNAFLVRSGRASDEEELRDFNRKIVALGEAMGKPVVATGDVHFLHPEDEKFRAILMSGMGFDDADEQAPLYFRTTDDMLEEFAYLGADKAREVVIENPRAIADRVGKLSLFPAHPEGKETFQPVWEDAADNIQSMTYARAKALYGDPLPDIVKARLEKELNAIIGYGFATLYNIAQKLVSKSESDGYLVGSRGSVGSSLVATMCGITEVNPVFAV
nr:exonuclease domain-containing protein [Clostridia bacterium]